MRIPHLVALLVATALASTPAAVADPSRATQTTEVSKSPPAVTDVAQYAAREAKDARVATFRGGGEVVIIGASTATLLLVILILVIVF